MTNLPIAQEIETKLRYSIITDKTRIQLTNLKIVIWIVLLIAWISFITEVIYYVNVWPFQKIVMYTIPFVIYNVLLLLSERWLYQQDNRLPAPDFKKFRILLFFWIYLITLVVTVVVFVSKRYGAELYFLASTTILFGVAMLLNNKERAWFLVYHFLLYVIGSLMVLPYLDNFENKNILIIDFAKAFNVNLLTYFVGRMSYSWFYKTHVNHLKLKESMKYQMETLNYLADELQFEKSDLAAGENLQELNEGIKQLLFEFSESKSDLSKALAMAEEASKAKEAFMTNMSHEIRTPLNAIIGLIRELTTDELNPVQKLHVTNINNAAQHLLALVNNVLDMTKLHAGGLDPVVEDFNLQSVLDNMVSLMTSKANEKGLELDYYLDFRIPEALKGDPNRLKQILFNILGNAVKFTSKGYVKIDARLLGESDNICHIQIDIKDSGIGMEKGFLDKVFNRFSQDFTAKSFGSGTGLGMPITKELVNLLGGSIQIDSDTGNGTLVSLKFDFPKGDIQNLIPDQRPINTKLLEGKKILLVEDDLLNRIVATNSLKRFGCEYQEAHNGKEAIQKLREDDYDLILMDIQMPVMSGKDATNIIRNEMKLTIPILALTANSFKSDIDEYLKVGMNDYVTKPYNELILFRKMLRALDINEVEHKKSSIANTRTYSTTELKQLGDDEFVAVMINAFYDIIGESIEDLQQASDNEDNIRVAYIAHKLKPNIERFEVISLIDPTKKLQADRNEIWSDEKMKEVQNYILSLQELRSQIKSDLGK